MESLDGCLLFLKKKTKNRCNAAVVPVLEAGAALAFGARTGAAWASSGARGRRCLCAVQSYAASLLRTSRPSGHLTALSLLLWPLCALCALCALMTLTAATPHPTTKEKNNIYHGFHEGRVSSKSEATILENILE